MISAEPVSASAIEERAAEWLQRRRYWKDWSPHDQASLDASAKKEKLEKFFTLLRPVGLPQSPKAPVATRIPYEQFQKRQEAQAAAPAPAEKKAAAPKKAKAGGAKKKKSAAKKSAGKKKH